MLHILTAITVITKLMALVDAGSAIYARLKSTLDELRARHAAGQRFTSADIMDDVAKMDILDDQWRALLAERRAAAGVTADAPDDYDPAAHENVPSMPPTPA